MRCLASAARRKEHGACHPNGIAIGAHLTQRSLRAVAPAWPCWQIADSTCESAVVRGNGCGSSVECRQVDELVWSHVPDAST